jgi:hypothetical protein
MAALNWSLCRFIGYLSSIIAAFRQFGLRSGNQHPIRDATATVNQVEVGR